jgi:hypothetical protein
MDSDENDLHDVAAQLPALTKIARDLEYRLPESGRPLANIVLTREQAAALLSECTGRAFVEERGVEALDALKAAMPQLVVDAVDKYKTELAKLVATLSDADWIALKREEDQRREEGERHG